MLKELAAPGAESARMATLLAQLDRIPDRPDATYPLPWDEHGLPLLYKGAHFAETDIARAVGDP